jgi:predicted metal-dependent hydrolase
MIDFAPMAVWNEMVGSLPVTIRNVKGSRGLRIRVAGSGVVVTKPRWVSKKAAVEFVAESEAWIAKELSRRAARPLDRVLYRGVEHEIKQATFPPVRLADGAFWAPGEQESDRLAEVLVWLRRRAKPLLRESVSRWSPLLGVSPTKVGVRDQTSRWGSCSSRGSVSLNWRLVMAPPEVLEYIVIHELAHLKEHNHSARFWALVAAHCPEYRLHEEWLSANGEPLIELGRELF